MSSFSFHRIGLQHKDGCTQLPGEAIPRLEAGSRTGEAGPGPVRGTSGSRSRMVGAVGEGRPVADGAEQTRQCGHMRAVGCPPARRKLTREGTGSRAVGGRKSRWTRVDVCKQIEELQVWVGSHTPPRRQGACPALGGPPAAGSPPRAHTLFSRFRLLRGAPEPLREVAGPRARAGSITTGLRPVTVPGSLGGLQA